MAEPDDLSIISYAGVAQRYREQYGAAVEKEDRWFGSSCKSLDEAIRRASMSVIPSRAGKLIRHSHQQRIPEAVLKDVCKSLLLNRDILNATQSFDELFTLIQSITESIYGCGRLLVYDTAQRIGCYLKLQPQEIYLHQGTMLGAKALGLMSHRSSIPLHELPVGLRSLSGSQLEDVLCIYRSALGRLHQSGELSDQTNRDSKVVVRNHC